MYKISLMFCLALLSACASNPPATAAKDKVLERETAAKDRHCLRSTGSLIKRQDKACTAIGQVLTAEDLAGTGALGTADAVRTLVPRLR